jgi:hypothetical protein
MWQMVNSHRKIEILTAKSKFSPQNRNSHRKIEILTANELLPLRASGLNDDVIILSHGCHWTRTMQDGS